MLEFTSAVESAEEEAENEAKIAALMAGEKSPESPEGATGDKIIWLKKPMTREDAEAEVYEDPYTEFLLDGRTMRAYQPNAGQLAFMLASLGRGQTSDGRFAAILNIMFECLRDEDKDYLENRMLSRDRKKRLDLKTLEGIFEGLTKEWFARPIQ